MDFGKWVRFQQVKKEMDFIFLGSKITLNSDYRHTIKTGEQRNFGRKAMTNLDSILKSRDITLSM